MCNPNTTVQPCRLAAPDHRITQWATPVSKNDVGAIHRQKPFEAGKERSHFLRSEPSTREQISKDRYGNPTCPGEDELGAPPANGHRLDFVRQVQFSQHLFQAHLFAEIEPRGRIGLAVETRAGQELHSFAGGNRGTA